jgi:hypothetical protein
MRTVLLDVAILLSSLTLCAQTTIRQVDFKNFTYPLSGPLLGHDGLKWLGNPKDGYSKKKPIHLVRGSDLARVSSLVVDGHYYSQSEGFTLQSVSFADVAGDGNEDAIVVLRYHTGGTQTTDYVYVFSFADGKPKLLAYCYTGDRGYSGLNRVYGERGQLVFELLNPKKAEGLCCSSGIVRTRYVWQDGRFEMAGHPEYAELKEP